MRTQSLRSLVGLYKLGLRLRNDAVTWYDL